jgi:iron complex outermembrane receptor protein
MTQITVTGTADEGYRVGTVSTVGPLENTAVLDTPYSISVVPSDLIENLQAVSPDQILKVDPFVQEYMPTTLNARPTFDLRGFYVTTVAEDGLRNYNGWVNSLEDVDRVEILTGLSGFLYGQGDVGGLVNYVAKRPTAAPLATITTGVDGGSSLYAHGDFGGPIGDGQFGYRLNVMDQGGDTAIQNQSVDRNLVTAAFDWHPIPKALVQLDLSHRENDTQGLPGSWGAVAGAQYPTAPDASKLWTQKWTFDDLKTDDARFGGSYAINDIFSFRTEYIWATYNQHQLSLGDTILANGTFTEAMQERAPRTLSTDRGYAFLDAKFRTYLIEHKITTGFDGDHAAWQMHKDSSFSATLTGPFTFADPLYVAKPSYTVGIQPDYTSSRSIDQNVMIGDDASLGESWEAIVGANNARIISENYATTGALSSYYDRVEATPTASLIFKPLPTLSTYATYMQALEQGSTAALTYNGLKVTNADEIMAPVVDHQYEVGAKATLGDVLATLALFDITRASDAYTPNGTSYTFSADGRERHQGVELGLSGKITRGLTLFGGVTAMDPKITESPSSPQLVGKLPTNVSKQMAKLYAEYSVPGIPNLTLTGGVYAFGPFYADSANTQKLPGVTVEDIGARYQVKLGQEALILRLTVENISNKSYWISGSFEGDPRTFVASAQIKL